MALNIKNQDVERLVDEVLMMTGESKTEAEGVWRVIVAPRPLWRFSLKS